MALLETTEETLHLARAHLMCNAWIMISQAQAEPALTQLDQAERLFSDQATGDDLGMLKAWERARALAILGRAGRVGKWSWRARRSSFFDRRNEPELGAGCVALGEGLGLSGEYDRRRRCISDSRWISSRTSAAGAKRFSRRRPGARQDVRRTRRASTRRVERARVGD